MKDLKKDLELKITKKPTRKDVFGEASDSEEEI